MKSTKESLLVKVKDFLDSQTKYNSKSVRKFSLELLDLEPSTELKFLCFYSESEAKKLTSEIEILKSELLQIGQLPQELLEGINNVFQKVLASVNRSLEHPANTDCYD